MDGEERFQKKELRKILGIKAKQTISADLAAIGEENPPWNWETVKQLIGLKLFLAIGRGNPQFSRETYSALIELGKEQLNAVFKHLNIDLEQEFQRVKNDYQNQQQRTTFSYRTNRRRIDTAGSQSSEEQVN